MNFIKILSNFGKTFIVIMSSDFSIKISSENSEKRSTENEHNTIRDRFITTTSQLSVLFSENIKNVKFKTGYKPSKKKISKLKKLGRNIYTGRGIVYAKLKEEGFMLPRFNTRGASMMYLISLFEEDSLGVMNGSPYMGPEIKLPRKHLLILLRALYNSANKVLYIKKRQLPDKKWIIDMIYNLYPACFLFWDDEKEETEILQNDMDYLVNIYKKVEDFRGVFKKERKITRNKYLKAIKLFLEEIELLNDIESLQQRRENINKKWNEMDK